MSYEENIFKRGQADYVFRVNKVIDYIEENICSHLTLDELASKANFSKYHFHRIFHKLTGEKLFDFIWRVRIERAASNLVLNPDRKITDVALSYGFANSQIFSRKFKQRYNITPSKFRKENKILKINSNNIDLASFSPSSLFESGEIPKSRTIDFTGRKVAYLRYTGSYKNFSQNMFIDYYFKLYSWAGDAGVIMNPFELYILYHDHPDTTQEEKQRLSMCIPIDESIKTTRDIGNMDIMEGKYLFTSFKIRPDEIGIAWDWVYHVCLPENGLIPISAPTFEFYDNKKIIQNGYLYVQIGIPVKPIRKST